MREGPGNWVSDRLQMSREHVSREQRPKTSETISSAYEWGKTVVCCKYSSGEISFPECLVVPLCLSVCLSVPLCTSQCVCVTVCLATWVAQTSGEEQKKTTYVSHLFSAGQLLYKLLTPSLVIFDIRALWRSALSARVPGCQKLQMTA